VYDDLKVAAILNEINGRDHTGTREVGVPAIFGMNFQAVSVAQKTTGGGYLDGSGRLSPPLEDALVHNGPVPREDHGEAPRAKLA